MADTISSTKSLTVVAEFGDGDDRSITVDNPRNNLQWTDIENLNQYAMNVLIGDRGAANFYRMKSAHITERRSVIFDPDEI